MRSIENNEQRERLFIQTSNFFSLLLRAKAIAKVNVHVHVAQKLQFLKQNHFLNVHDSCWDAGLCLTPIRPTGKRLSIIT